MHNYVKRLGSSDEVPGWFRARVSEYLRDGSCTITYNDTPEAAVFEIIDLRTIEWSPCSGRAKRFVPVHLTPVTTKSKQKPCLKYFSSSEHSFKAYADDATLISDCLETHARFLQLVDQKALDLDLSFKSSKCVSLLFDGHNHSNQGVELSGGITKSTAESGTKFLGKSLEVSLSATKYVANKILCSLLSDLLSAIATDVVESISFGSIAISYIVSLPRFHLSVHDVTPGAISKMENMATHYLKKWLSLPISATCTCAILYYPGLCCPNVSQVSRQAKLSLLSCIRGSIYSTATVVKFPCSTQKITTDTSLRKAF